jgi:hypothetical protein
LTLLDSSTLNRFAQHRRPIVSEWVSEEGEGVTRQMRRLAASVRSDANDVLAELLDPEELEPAIAFVPADPDEGEPRELYHPTAWDKVRTHDLYGGDPAKIICGSGVRSHSRARLIG